MNNMMLVFVSTLLIVIIALIIRHRHSKKQSKQIIDLKNEQLRLLQEDKSWLLKEIHHRVKNNLQIVISLLESQSAFLENDALDAIRNGRNRIFAMSLIHQQFYQSGNMKAIDMARYIPDLMHHLSEELDPERNIRINMDIAAMKFDIAEAVPLALILNEVTTNSLKYAFKHQKHGIINIILQDSGDGKYQLIMDDNGSGLPQGTDIRKISSLGMKLIQGLSAQIDAELRIESKQGTRVVISSVYPNNLFRATIRSSPE